MDNYKFTKGKWFTTGISVFSEHSTRVIHSSKYNEKEDKYNALLISKAPEMLDMLNKCMLEFAMYRSEFGQGSKLQEDISKLIKEATEL